MKPTLSINQNRSAYQTFTDEELARFTLDSRGIEPSWRGSSSLSSGHAIVTRRLCRSALSPAPASKPHPRGTARPADRAHADRTVGPGPVEGFRFRIRLHGLTRAAGRPGPVHCLVSGISMRSHKEKPKENDPPPLALAQDDAAAVGDPAEVVWEPAILPSSSADIVPSRIAA